MLTGTFLRYSELQLVKVYVAQKTSITDFTASLEEKLDEILSFVRSKRYLVFADTYINTIFVSEEAWRAR